jgi:ATP-dependent DNA helicase RecG
MEPESAATGERRLHSPVASLMNIGPARETALAEIGIHTIENLISFYPRRYLDRSRIMKVKDLVESEHEVTLVGEVAYLQPMRSRRGKSWLVAGVDDGTDVIQLKWFQGISYWQKALKVGDMVAVSGIAEDKGVWQIIHPAVDRLGEAGDREMYNTGRIISLYPGTLALRKVGLESATMRKIMRNALNVGRSEMDEYLPLGDLAQVGAMTRPEAMEQIHFPTDQNLLFAAWNRVRYEELFFYQLLFALRRYHNRIAPGGSAFERIGPVTKKVLAALPFELTDGQKDVLHEIRADLESPVPMQRLLQGEVGSGKTTVALLAMAMAADSGFQSVMMAPTELLAEQHAQKILPIANTAGLSVRLMRGKQRTAERREILAAIASGLVEITIGTHALLNEKLSFPRLGLVIIDEQHRFGVEQRTALRSKGIRPNLLLMTATPIPRTMRLAHVGDLDISSLRELPGGPRRVVTTARGELDRPKVYSFLIERAKLGERVFIICPLIEESEKLDTEAAIEYHRRVSGGILKAVKVGLLHGRQKSEEKLAALERFRSGQTPIIVATPVIEVGVDVPEASVMLVENPERFGLAQLHQMRGRIGRLGQKAWMILLPGQKLTPEAGARIKVLEETTDGFVIAEKDLELRGSGEFFGTRQSGEYELRYSDPVRDEALLMAARAKALELIESDPDLRGNSRLRAKFEQEHAHKLGFLAGG